MSPARPRLLTLMGSGETAPVMAKVHRALLERLGPARQAGPDAVLLDTPYGFQENADDISARTVTYFGHNLGVRLEVATWRSGDVDLAVRERALARVGSAGYVFAGPGSPTYALSVWRGSALRAVLADKLARGGCVTFSSAAALTLGTAALPVYEIYKCGRPPRWVDGLDLLADLGLSAAVLPHFDNAEGRDHDTRFCYLGERRLRVLESHLPPGAFVLGIDEHTACVLDLDADAMTVLGRGGVSVRHAGVTVTFPSGRTVALDEVRRAALADRAVPAPVAPPAEPPRVPLTLRVEADRLERAFEDALTARDAAAAAGAVLTLAQLVLDWFADTEADDLDWAQAVLRRLVVRLGDLAHLGLADRRQSIAPLVDELVRVRDRARADGAWAVADAVRDRLAGAGIEVHDSPGGTSWTLATP